MKREISDLYDEYLHTPMGRRNFMQRLTVLAGGVTAASAALTMLEGTAAHAAQVAEDDPRREAPCGYRDTCQSRTLAPF
jgi:carboxymethylenebutenolidase